MYYRFLILAVHIETQLRSGCTNVTLTLKPTAHNACFPAGLLAF